MTCDLNRLDAYVDGELSPSEASELETHLRACPVCAAEALARLQLKRSVRMAALEFSPSPAFRARVAGMLAPPRRRFRFIRTGLLAGALAAALLIALTAPFVSRYFARQRETAEILDLHVATLASSNPVDVVSTDRHTVKPWFQGKLPFTFNLPDLANSPYTLLGGKLIYFNGAPEAQLLFSIRQHRISVFILKGAASLPAGLQTENGFAMESFTAAGLHCIVVSDAAPSDVHALADLLRAAQSQ